MTAHRSLGQALLLLLLPCGGPDRAASGRRAPSPAAGPASPAACIAGPLADSTQPSREGFFREVLFAQATPRTPRFDDYTPGSYHVDKLDLASGLPGEAAHCGLALHALIVVGPAGPLWTYHVVALLRDGDAFRLNSLVMPHARITGKGTGRVAVTDVDRWFAQLDGSAVVSRGPPPSQPVQPRPADRPTLDREFSYDLLVVRYGPTGSAPEYWHGNLMRAGSSSAVERLIASTNALLDGTEDTYPVGRRRERGRR